MKLCILVDGFVYPDQKAFGFERRNMVLKIGVVSAATERHRICLRRHYSPPLS